MRSRERRRKQLCWYAWAISLDLFENKDINLRPLIARLWQQELPELSAGAESLAACIDYNEYLLNTPRRIVFARGSANGKNTLGMSLFVELWMTYRQETMREIMKCGLPTMERVFIEWLNVGRDAGYAAYNKMRQNLKLEFCELTAFGKKFIEFRGKY